MKINYPTLLALATGQELGWILTVRDGLQESYARHPWLAGAQRLGLAGGHYGIIACMLVIPLALICGAIRQIPIGWRLIDCSFGVVGAILLAYALKIIRALENDAA